MAFPFIAPLSHSSETHTRDYPNIPSLPPPHPVFARNELHKYISDVKWAAEATGLGHVHDNKGGIVLAMDFLDTWICFVSAHLAAHEGEEHKERRNADYAETSSSTRSRRGGR